MREMKDSGLEWLGNVSSDVKLVPLKYLLKKERMPIKVGPFGSQLSGTDFLKEESDFWVYNQRIVLDENYEAGDAYISSEKYETMIGFHVYEDDILITTRGTIGKISRIPHIHKPGILHPCIIRFRIDDSLYDYRLLKLIFNQSDFVTEQILYKSNATTIEVIYSDTLKNVILPVWDMQTQRKIADFLDTKCSEIDALTADIQTQIDTLEQYKRSVITATVTKGLNPDVEMKDSGIEWIGEIPVTWDIIRGKYLLKYLQKPVKEDDGVITCFRDGEVTLRSNRREDGFTMSDKEIGYQGIDAGDLVVHGMDGFAGAIGISDSRGKASPVLNVMDTKQNKRYIMYYLRSMAYSDVFVALATGIRVRSCDLRWNKLADLSYPVPSIEEQTAIVEYIDTTLEKTDVVISKKKAQLETLDEYKKSLIYEYVTGKKEVPSI
jgi:type I restriction enzyme S subunit